MQLVYAYQINRGQKSGDKKGLGTTIPHDLREGDDEFDAYRKRMMVAYRFRPNPLVRIQLIPVCKFFIFYLFYGICFFRIIQEGHTIKVT